MLVVTLLCVVCGFAVQFPRTVLNIGELLVALALPYLALYALTRYSHHSEALAIFCSVGAIFGLFVGIMCGGLVLLDVGYDGPWKAPVAELVVVPWPGIGAFVAGMPLVLCEAYLKWYESKSR